MPPVRSHGAESILPIRLSSSRLGSICHLQFSLACPLYSIESTTLAATADGGLGRCRLRAQIESRPPFRSVRLSRKPPERPPTRRYCSVARSPSSVSAREAASFLTA